MVTSPRDAEGVEETTDVEVGTKCLQQKLNFYLTQNLKLSNP